MRITKEQLKQIIKEEFEIILQETEDEHDFPASRLLQNMAEQEENFFVALYDLVTDDYQEVYEAIDNNLHADYVEGIPPDSPEEAAEAFLMDLKGGDLYQ
tara:strand:- start:2173 stop:2472 length:300 start_codon:yes stop_codon:yes gene_type:complete